MNELVNSTNHEVIGRLDQGQGLGQVQEQALEVDLSPLKDKILQDQALAACKDEMGAILQKKINEMEEADITSSKDVTEIIASMHKMRLEELKLEIKLAELEIRKAAANKSTINNTQLNVGNDALKGLPGVLRSILSA